MTTAILSLSTAAESAHRAAVRSVELAAELRRLGFEVAMAMAARRAA